MATMMETATEPWNPPTTIVSLRSGFVWTLTGNLVYSACQWGMISTLAKLGSAAVVGSFALGLAITAPIFMFSNLQLRGVQATDARSEFDFADYFTLRLMTTLAGLAIVCGLALGSGYDPTTRTVLLLVGVSKAIESLSDVVAGLLQKAERLDRVAISLMIRGVCSLVAFGMVFWRLRSLVAAAGSLVLVWLSVYLLYDLRQACRYARCKPGFFALRWRRLRTLALLSAPLGIVMTLISLNINVPRYLLEHALGPADLGIFASLAYLLVAVNLVVNALGQSVVARLARMFAAGDSQHFSATLRKLLAFGALLLLFGVPVAMCVGRPLLSFIYRPEYGQHVPLFAVMVATAGVASVASFLGYGMTAARSFRMQVPVIAASTLTTLLASILWIPRLGSFGAAYGLFVGACVQAIGSGAVLHGAIHRLREKG